MLLTPPCHPDATDWRECDSEGRRNVKDTTPSEVHRGASRVEEQENGLQQKLNEASSQKRDEPEAPPNNKFVEARDVQGLVTPDGGWGWAVAFGAALVATVIPTLSPSFGILFSPQLLQWQVSSTAVAVLFNAFMVAWKCAGVVMPTLTREFGFRRVAMTGALLTASCLTLSAFATSPEYLFVFFSLGCGVGNGMSCMGFLIISHYFKKRRGLANTFLTTGLGLGRFLSPLLIQLLQQTYGYRGATLVLGAVVLHGFLGTTLYQPVEWHMKHPPTCHLQQEAFISPKSPPGNSRRASPQLHLHSQENTHARVESRPSVQSSCSLASDRRSWLPAAASDLASTASVDSFDTLAKTDLTKPGQEPPQTRQGDNLLRRLWQMFTRILSALRRDLGILRRPLALIIALGATLVGNAQVNFQAMAPFAMQAAGHTLQTAAWCLSITGVTNLLFRMLASALSDCAWFNMRLWYMTAMFTMTAACMVFSFQTSVAGAAAVMGVWGAALGVYQGLNNLHMVRIVGLENLASMYGSRNLSLALGFVTVGPLLGVVRDVSGSYAVSMWVVASLIFVSFLLWLLMPTAVAHEQRRKAKQASSI